VFGFPLLVSAIAAVILGGRASVAGPVVGTAFLLVLPEIARPLADERLLVQGVLLIIVIIYLPQGIVDSLVQRYRSFTTTRPAAAARPPQEGPYGLPSA
jgi:branched-chain amino acid transport system permease protein